MEYVVKKEGDADLFINELKSGFDWKSKKGIDWRWQTNANVAKKES